MEALKTFFSSIKLAVNDTTLSFEEKLEKISSNYIDSLLENPELPLFILSEIRNDPDHLIQNVGFKDTLLGSDLLRQLMEKVKTGEFKPIHPLNFILNFIGMTVFPFIASPMLRIIGNLDQEAFHQLIAERKSLIPIWMMALLRK